VWDASVYGACWDFLEKKLTYLISGIFLMSELYSFSCVDPIADSFKLLVALGFTSGVLNWLSFLLDMY
jgi:hypothetical protein